MNLEFLFEEVESGEFITIFITQSCVYCNVFIHRNVKNKQMNIEDEVCFRNSEIRSSRKFLGNLFHTKP